MWPAHRLLGEPLETRRSKIGILNGQPRERGELAPQGDLKDVLRVMPRVDECPGEGANWGVGVDRDA